MEWVCASKALPAVPEVAMTTISLCNNPDVDMGRLAVLISSDTALTAKMLQLANSSFYGGRTKVKTVRAALVRLGLKVSRVAVLGFSLASKTEFASDSEFDAQRFWRYALTSASAARLIAERVCPSRKDEAFAAGLMQDIGVLAFHCAMPEVYSEVLAAQRAEPTLELWELEAQKLGTTHPEVGGELLRRWRLPAEIYEPICYHHDTGDGEAESVHAGNRKMAEILRLAAQVARLFNDAAKGITHEIVMNMVRERFSLSPRAMEDILERVESTVRETAKLFQIDPVASLSYNEIKAQAAYEIARLSVDMEEEAQSLRAEADKTAVRARELEEDKVELAKRLTTDELTGVLVRREFVRLLKDELAADGGRRSSMSLLFLDVDGFKSINANRGHLDGDVVLRCLGGFLKERTRREDAVARFGGDEFIMMLPRTELEAAMKLAERLRIGAVEVSKEWLADFEGITLSVGLFCSSCQDAESAEFLLRQADTCLLAAKAAGGNCTRYSTA